MKHIGYIFSIILLFSSCSPAYLFSTIDSADQRTEKDEKGRFTTHYDNVDVSYSFNGNNGPIFISIYNKGKEPLYIDWQRSSLIIDGVSNSYVGKTMTLSGSTHASTSTVEYPLQYNSSQTSGSFNGTITKESENISFIPPNSKIQYNTLNLNKLNFSKINNTMYDNASLYWQIREYCSDKSDKFH